MAAGPIAQAISEGFKLIRQIRETSVIRKLRKCVECGEKYIQVNEKEGEFDYLSDEKRDKKLKYYHKKFFKLNN
jgi:hypothetical protein